MLVVNISSFNIVLSLCFYLQDFIKIVRLLLTTVSINEFIMTKDVAYSHYCRSCCPGV